MRVLARSRNDLAEASNYSRGEYHLSFRDAEAQGRDEHEQWALHSRGLPGSLYNFLSTEHLSQMGRGEFITRTGHPLGTTPGQTEVCETFKSMDGIHV